MDGYTRGEIPDYQMSAFLMALLFRHDRPRSRRSDGAACSHPAKRLDLSEIPGLKVDKHSTGGVGDKTSLIAAPLAAAAGVMVPMISGRALGHTGGTLDKLESIPGFRTNLTVDEVKAQVAKIGLASSARPRNSPRPTASCTRCATPPATVESIPLIASSIMSKKLAEGIDALVLDVKVGAGAFMKTQVDARRLAQMMVAHRPPHGQEGRRR